MSDRVKLVFRLSRDTFFHFQVSQNVGRDRNFILKAKRLEQERLNVLIKYQRNFLSFFVKRIRPKKVVLIENVP